MTFSQFMTNLKLRYLNKYHKVRYSDTTYKLQQVYPTGEDYVKVYVSDRSYYTYRNNKQDRETELVKIKKEMHLLSRDTKLPKDFEFTYVITVVDDVFLDLARDGQIHVEYLRNGRSPVCVRKILQDPQHEISQSLADKCAHIQVTKMEIHTRPWERVEGVDKHGQDRVVEQGSDRELHIFFKYADVDKVMMKDDQREENINTLNEFFNKGH